MRSTDMTCIIIDDEDGAIQLLESLLKPLKGVTISGSFNSVNKAIKQLIEKQPDLIFLDIRMPGVNGLDLADEFMRLKIRSKIIFVTGYDEYAIAAIKRGAFDYLLKPVDPEELNNCLMRARASMDLLTENQPATPGKIRVNNRSGCAFIDPDSILYIEADVNYSFLYDVDGSRLTVSINIGKLEKMINRSDFIRINRSFLINRNYIAEIKPRPARIIFDKRSKIQTLQISERAARVLMQFID